MKKKLAPNFLRFLETFPEVDLPVTLTEESQIEFERRNEPLSQESIHEFILMGEEGELDEFTEFVPCLRVKETHDFHAVIYWRAGLMDYEYILATFDKKGALLDKKVIAGTKIHDGQLIRSVATIEDDWLIYIVVGKSDANEQSFRATDSRSLNMELLATGEIVPV